MLTKLQSAETTNPERSWPPHTFWQSEAFGKTRQFWKPQTACFALALTLALLILWSTSPGGRNLGTLRFGAAHLGAEDLFVWTAYTLFAAILAVALYRLRTLLPVGKLSTALTFFFAGQFALHYLQFHDPAGNHSRLSTLLRLLDALIAVSTAIVLPNIYRHVHFVFHRAARSVEDENRLTVAMESTLDAVFIHQAVRDPFGTIVDFRLTYLNRNGEALLGESRQALTGRPLGELFPLFWVDGRFNLYKQVVESGEPALLDFQHTLPHRDPSPARSLLRTQVVRLEDGVLVTCVDVTAERATTQSLRHSLAFNKALVTSSSFAIVVMDLDGTIRSINPAAVEMLGYQPEQLVGRNVTILHDPIELLDRSRRLTEQLHTFIPPDSAVLFAQPIRSLEEDSEWVYLCRNGVRLPVQLRVNSVVDEDGSTIAFMASSYDLTDRKQTDQYIYHIAHHDPLTGLPGRTLLRERLEAAVNYGERTKTVFAVLMVDLDHFKRINDSLGHTNGDIVLREIAFRLRSAVRKVDTVARFGGDEFVVLLNGLNARTEAEVVARKLTQALVPPIHAGGHHIIITTSIGISIYPESLDPDELLKHADIALCHSKSLGRNGMAVFSPDLGEMLLDKLKMETALRDALKRDEFFLVYQPQVSLSNNRLIGVEALIRWRSPDAGLIMPNVFIPLAEETGLIIPIGAWALETACREIAGLHAEVGLSISVAVNLSPTQVHERRFHDTVELALQHSGLPAACLELEITERLLMRDSEEALQIIERIQALGVTTAIDDFGTGFSNMSYITRFKVDRLKIDRSFVSRCLSDANSLAVTTAIIALAHSLDMEVIAEGVETVEQAVMLRNLECDSAQGYLYARPLTIEQVTQFARSAFTLSANLELNSLWSQPTEHSGDAPMLEA